MEVGLRNLGNSCYMNSALQCLLGNSLMVDFLLHESPNFLNTKNPHGTGGVLSQAFRSLLKMAKLKKGSYLDTAELKSAIDQFTTQFHGNDQHDAHEFLVFFLDGIHEDHNRVRVKVHSEEPDITAALLKQRRLNRLAAESWQRYLLCNKSFLVDLFQGQLKSKLECRSCGYFSIRFESFMYLSLPVVEDRPEMDLYDILVEEYTQKEEIDGMKCAACKEISTFYKSTVIWILPPFLIVHLKRFTYGLSGFKKIETEVKFPVTAPLDLSKIVKQDETDRQQRQFPIYLCYGLIYHRGRMQFGHYTSCCLSEDSGKWSIYDDETVRSVDFPNGINDEFVRYSDVYVAFFERQDVKQQSSLIRTQSVTRPEHWPHNLRTKSINELAFAGLNAKKNGKDGK